MSIFNDMLLPENKEHYIEKIDSRRFPNYNNVEFVKELLHSPEFDDGINRLKNGDYWISIPEKKMISKYGTSKKRVVYIFTDEERILFRYMAFVLHKYDYKFSPSLYSYCANRHMHEPLRELNRIRSTKDSYVAKLDISAYGASVDPNLLNAMLETFLEDDPELLSFLTWLTSRCLITNGGSVIQENTGTISGLGITSFLNNVFLSDLDWEFAERTLFYERYTDDIVICRESKESVLDLSQEYIDRIQQRYLSVNPEKYGIYGNSDEFSYLGLHFLANGGLDIAPVTFKRMKRKVKIKAHRARRRVYLKAATPDEAVGQFFNQVNRSFFGEGDMLGASYAQRYLPVITRTDSLKELDQYVLQYARYIPTGRFGKKNNRLEYEDLKELGYRALVNKYHKIRE